MRLLAATPLLLVAACATHSDAPDYVSVRDRLTDGPTRLTVGPTDVAGDVIARRNTSGGWLENHASVAIESGALELTTDATGSLEAKRLALRD